MSYPSYYKLIVVIGMALLSFPVAPAQTSGPFSPTSRAQALQTLKGCSHRPIARGCSEDTAEFLIRLYERGDHALLKPLLDAGRRSDGALSETLGGFYANVLGPTPRKFLDSIKSRSITEQRNLCFLAGSTDGGGMPPEMLSAVRGSLRGISVRRGSLSAVARRCSAEVDRANAKRFGRLGLNNFYRLALMAQNQIARCKAFGGFWFSWKSVKRTEGVPTVSRLFTARVGR